MMQASFTKLDGRLSLVTTAIHAGHELCPEVAKNCSLSPEIRLMEEDPYTDQMARLFPNHITVQSSRFLVDLNRSREKCVYIKPEDCWGLPIDRQDMDAQLLERLYGEYDEFYALLDDYLGRLFYRRDSEKVTEPLLILDLHSYNHRRGGPEAEPAPQEGNPDIIIGRNNLDLIHYDKAEKLRQLLDGKPFGDIKIDCRCDVKFPGGNFSRYLNSRYPEKVICLAIEFKKIFMDEHTGELNLSLWKQLQQLFYDAVVRWISPTTF